MEDSSTWLCIFILVIDDLSIKKRKNKEKEKNTERKEELKIIYIFHCIILLRARVYTWYLVTLSIYDSEKLYASSFPN